MSARPPRSSATIIGICIIIGLVLAAIVAPVAATAAGQLVEISSASGRKADVTRAAQLQVAEASPHQLVRGYNSSGGSCVAVLTAPATKAVVVQTAWVDFSDLNGTYDLLGLYVGSSCLGGTVFGAVHTDVVGVQALDFGAGLVVPAGQSLWIIPTNGTGVYVSAFGYKIPPEAAPTTAESVTGGQAPPR
jgi:hypothetical protein